MAPRLTSLDGKTVYLVSDGFPSADTFLNQIKIWFNKNTPSVNVEYRLKAGGFADEDPKLLAELKQKANAVIMAIGHCSTCSPATVGHCMTFEKMGLPSAPIVTVAFKDLAKTNAAKRGMPLERICFTPHPVWGKTVALHFVQGELEATTCKDFRLPDRPAPSTSLWTHSYRGWLEALNLLPEPRSGEAALTRTGRCGGPA